MKVKVNKDVCDACTAIASNCFEIGDDGLAETINPEDKENKLKEISEEDKTDVLDAADGCPVGAIEVVE